MLQDHWGAHTAPHGVEALIKSSHKVTTASSTLIDHVQVTSQNVHSKDKKPALNKHRRSLE
jgi:hypothetical protein